MEVVCRRHFSHSPITTTTSSPTLLDTKSLVNEQPLSDDSPPPPQNSTKTESGSEVASSANVPTHQSGPGGGGNGMVECPKCDLVLGSSRSLGGHMTMMHSRNSCKTLKCPKCNWHYKYQETLEIHMKEKHPANDGNTCTYCLNKEAHPRLARGENYSCGYKPYKCEICNYSTTTKGNLSIHMQSDKHANNVHELQVNQKRHEETVTTEHAISNVNHAPETDSLAVGGNLSKSPISSIEPTPKFLGKFNHSSTTSTSKTTINSNHNEIEGSNVGGKNLNCQIKPKRRCRLCGFEAITIRDLRRHMAAGIHQTPSSFLPPPHLFYSHHQNDSALDPTPDQSGMGYIDDNNTVNDEQVVSSRILNYKIKSKLKNFMSVGRRKQVEEIEREEPDFVKNEAQSDEITKNLNIFGFNLGTTLNSLKTQNCDDSQTFLDSQILEYLHRCQSLHSVTLKFKSNLCHIFKDKTSKTCTATDQPPFVTNINRVHPFFNNIYGCAVCYNFSAHNLKYMELHLRETQADGYEDHEDADCHHHLDPYLNHIKQGEPENEWQMVYFSGLRGKEASRKRLTIYCNLCDLYFQTLAQTDSHESSPKHAMCLVLIDVLKEKIFSGSGDTDLWPKQRGSLSSERSSFTFSRFYVRCVQHSTNFLTTLALMKHVIESLSRNKTLNACGAETYHSNSIDSEQIIKLHDCRLERLEFAKCPAEKLIALSFNELQYGCAEESMRDIITGSAIGGPTGSTGEYPLDFGLLPFLLPHGMAGNKSSMLEMALTKPTLKSHSLPFYNDEVGDTSFNYQKIFAHYILPQLSSTFSSQKPNYGDRDTLIDNIDKMVKTKTHISSAKELPTNKITRYRATLSREKKLKLIKPNNYNMPLTPIEKNKLFLNSNQKDLSQLPNYTQQLTRSPVITSNKKYLRKKKYSTNWLKSICPHCSMCFNKTHILHSHIKRVHHQDVNYDQNKDSKGTAVNINEATFNNMQLSGKSCMVKDIADRPNDGTLTGKDFKDFENTYFPQAFSDNEMKSFSAFFHYLASCSVKGERMDHPYLCPEPVCSRSSALEKFLDPARPYKCGVCRESFTQKNILLVHYNSVSHLHRLKRSLYLQNSVKAGNTSQSHGYNNEKKMSLADAKSSNDDYNLIQGNSKGLEPKPLHYAKAKHVLNNYSGKTGCNTNAILPPKHHSHQHLSPTFDSALANIGIEMVKDYDASEKRLIEENIKYDNDDGHWFICKKCSEGDGLYPIDIPMRTQSLWKLRDHLESSHGYVIGDDAIESLLGEIKKSNVTPNFTTTTTKVKSNKSRTCPPSSLTKRKFDAMKDADKDDEAKNVTSLTNLSCATVRPTTNENPKCSKAISSLSKTAIILPTKEEQLKDDTTHSDALNFAPDEPKPIPLNNDFFLNPLYFSPTDPHAMRMLSMAYPHQSPNMLNASAAMHHPLKGSSPHLPMPYNFNNDYVSPFFGQSMPTPFYPPSPSSFSPFALNPTHMNHLSPYMYYPPVTMDPFAATQPPDFFSATAAAFYNYYYGPGRVDKECRASAVKLVDKEDVNSQHIPVVVHEPADQTLIVDSNAMHIDNANNINYQQSSMGKRARTRINDDQLKILRANFDINNSPTEEQIKNMSEKSGLPQKVIKHWFRNTLFKERQRNKDSPYNFNNPPLTRLPISLTSDSLCTDLMYDANCGIDIKDEIDSINCKSQVGPDHTATKVDSPRLQSMCDVSQTQTKIENDLYEDKAESHSKSAKMNELDKCYKSPNCYNDLPRKIWSLPQPKMFDNVEEDDDEDLDDSCAHISPQFSSRCKDKPNVSLPYLDVAKDESLNNHFNVGTMAEEHLRLMTSADLAAVACGGRRANRTRFSDTQIRVLQEYFERNAYPKDDELDKLSKVLGLSPRVIVVWFQNARQKARKHYETNAYNYGISKSVSPHPLVADNNANSFSSLISSSNDKNSPTGDIKSKSTFGKREKACEDIYTQSEDSNDYYQKSDDDDEAEECTYSNHHPYKNTDGLRKSPSYTFDHKDHEKNKLPEGIVSLTNNDFTRVSAHYNIDKIKIEPNEHLALAGDNERVHERKESHYTNETKGLTIKQENMSLYPINSNLPGKMPNDYYKSYKCNDLNFEESSPTTDRSQSVDSLNVMINSDSHNRYSPETVTSNQASIDDNGNKKRLRTNISPEQLLYLHRHYQVESNPSKLVMEKIAKDINLKKRVVQVWFQNARARDKKSSMCLFPIVPSQSVTSTGKLSCINIGSTPKSTKRCPFCNMFFRARSLLELHVKIKHPSQYTDFETVMPPPSTSSSSSARSISTPINRINQNDGKAQEFEEGDHNIYFSTKGFEPVISELHNNLSPKLCHKVSVPTVTYNSENYALIRNNERTTTNGRREDHVDMGFNPLPNFAHDKDTEAPLDLSLPGTQTSNANKKNTPDITTRTHTKKSVSKFVESVGTWPANRSIKSESYETANSSNDNVEIDTNHDGDPIDIDSRRKLLRSQNSQLLDLMMNSNSNLYSTKNATSMEETDQGDYKREHTNSPISQNAESSNGQYVLSTLSAVAATCGSSLSNTKRYRTQMNNFQVACMKHIFNDYKTPTMTECEILGVKIGLPKRVIQVWFQNARAKEKKSKYGYIRTPGYLNEQEWKNASECKLCDVKYSASFPIQDHVFTDSHIANIKKLTGDWDFPASSIHSPYSQAPSSKHASPHHSNNNTELSPSPLSSENSKSSFNWDNNQLNGVQQPLDTSNSKESIEAEDVPINGAEKLSSKGQSKALKYLNYLYNNMLIPSPSQITFPPSIPPQYFNTTDNNPFASNDFNNYDPLVHGTPLGLLQISPSVLQEIQQILYNDINFETARFLFTQDGSSKEDLLKDAEDLVEEITAEVGFVCRRCLVVYPSEKACVDHVTKYCRYQNPVQRQYEASKDKVAILKLVQKYYKCSICYAYIKKESPHPSNMSNHHNYHYSTANDFNNHCKTSSLHDNDNKPLLP